MTSQEFDAIFLARMQKASDVLTKKGDEYASNGERLWNFKRAADEFPDVGGTGPAGALLGMLRKHWVSIADLVDRHDNGHKVKLELVDEKIGDAINYLILLEALLRE